MPANPPHVRRPSAVPGLIRGTSSPSLAVALALCSLAFASLPQPALAAVNVFLLRDYPSDWPWGTFALTCGMVLLTVIMEISLHTLEHKLHNQYAKTIINHIFEEVKMLGIISLVVVAATNFVPQGDTFTFQLVLNLFEWAHMVLFVFAILFAGLVGMFFLSIRITWNRWIRFEKIADKNPDMLKGEIQSGRGKNFYRALKRFKEQITAIDPNFKDISFTRYLKKNQRRNLIFVISMNWKSWLALVGISFINAIRGFISNKKEVWANDEQKEGCQLCPEMDGCPWRVWWPWNVVLFIAFVGYIPLIVFAIQTIHLRLGLYHFQRNRAQRTVYDAASELRPPNEMDVPLIDTDEASPNMFDHKTYFWRQSADFELQIVQIIVIYQIYYLAVHFLSITWECLSPESHSPGAGIVLFLVGLTPPIIFGLLCPTALQALTVLASTGNLLEREVLQEIYDKDTEEHSDLIKQAKAENTTLEEEMATHEPDAPAPRPRFASDLGPALLPAPMPLATLGVDTPEQPLSFQELMRRHAEAKKDKPPA